MAKKTATKRKAATTRKQKVRAMLTLTDYNGLSDRNKLEVQDWLSRRLQEIRTKPETLAKRYTARYQLDDESIAPPAKADA